MSTYSLQDFTETLQRVKLPAAPVEVIRAWGRSEEGAGCDWSGGFTLRLTDGSFAYVSGWCDYTGWGCQDGATVSLSNSLETLNQQHEQDDARSESDWDEAPADLNRWVAAGMPSDADVDYYGDIGVKHVL